MTLNFALDVLRSQVLTQGDRVCFQRVIQDQMHPFIPHIHEVSGNSEAGGKDRQSY